MTAPRRPLAIAQGEQIHLHLPGVDTTVVLSASEAVDLVEQMRALAPVMTEETDRVSDRGERFGQEDEPLDRASRLPDDGFPRSSVAPTPPPGTSGKP